MREQRTEKKEKLRGNTSYNYKSIPSIQPTIKQKEVLHYDPKATEKATKETQTFEATTF